MAKDEKPKKRSVGAERLWRKVSKLSNMKADLAVLENAFETFRALSVEMIGELHEETIASLDDLYQTIKSESEARLKSFNDEVRGNIMDNIKVSEEAKQ